MLACLLIAMASVNVCRLCTNVEKTINLFSTAGMRNEWSSRISAMFKYTASSSFVNATLVYKPFNLATPIAGL